jgi:hypothetical protein
MRRPGGIGRLLARGLGLAKVCIAFRFVDDEVKTEEAQVVADAPLKVEQIPPEFRGDVVVDDTFQEGDEDVGELVACGVIHRIYRVKITRGTRTRLSGRPSRMKGEAGSAPGMMMVSLMVSSTAAPS